MVMPSTVFFRFGDPTPPAKLWTLIYVAVAFLLLGWVIGRMTGS